MAALSQRDVKGGEGAVISPPRGIAHSDDYYLLLLFASVIIVLTKIKSVARSNYCRN